MISVQSLWSALAARAAARSMPGRRDDGYRLALVIEGGGSRAAFCSGMALAVERHGVLPCFDGVYAVSSGALVGAWMLSGQAVAAAEMLRDPQMLTRAINPSRLLRGGPVFDTEYLVSVAGGVDYATLLGNPVGFHPLATDAATGAVVDMHPFLSTPAAVRTALRVAIGLPLVSGPAVSLGGRRLFDGGLAEAIPVHTPWRQGATHILLLRTRRADQPALKASWGERIFVGSYLAARGRGAIRPWASRYRRGIADEQLLAAVCDDASASGTACVAQIRPPVASPSVPRTSRDPVLLTEAVSIGLETGLDAFRAMCVERQPAPRSPSIGRQPDNPVVRIPPATDIGPPVSRGRFTFR